MAKEIRWSPRAIVDQFEILSYWEERNKSNTYSIKLYHLFAANIEMVAQTPEIGTSTKYLNVRFKILGAYNIYYRILIHHIEVITIWDSRRNPKKFKL